LRFAGFEQYEKAVGVYRQALGDPNTNPVPSSPPSYSIVISKEMELLCVWQGLALDTDCTIVYWLVGSTPSEMQAACTALLGQGYSMVEAPDESPLGSRDKKNTERAVLKDKSGHRVGLIINPPVPWTDSQAQPSEPTFVIEPTHVINPPVTVGGTGDAS